MRHVYREALRAVSFTPSPALQRLRSLVPPGVTAKELKDLFEEAAPGESMNAPLAQLLATKDGCEKCGEPLAAGRTGEYCATPTCTLYDPTAGER